MSAAKKRKLNDHNPKEDNISKALDLLKFEFEKETDDRIVLAYVASLTLY